MAWLGTLWWCLLETCSGLCDKLRFGACNPLQVAEDNRLMTPSPLQRPVSDDLLMEIFSRMPAESVHKCKLAYEDWNTLFSTPDFNHNLFLPRASPTIIVHHCTVFENQLFYIDDDHRGGLKCTHISQKKPLKSSSYWPKINYYSPIRFSCNGLLFLDITHDFFGSESIVVNPITQRWVPLPLVPFVSGDICGAYFHPTAREFRVLWVSCEWYKYYEFKLLMPKSGNNPHIYWRALAKLQSRPMTDERPVNLHDCLHWMCEEYSSGRWFHFIMVFSIINEEFTLMPLFPSVQDKCKLLSLLDLDGYLSLWELTDVLSIWTKEDYYVSSSWTKRYSIDVKLLHKTVNIDEVRVVGCQNGALVIHWMQKGIFVYHLQHKSIKKFLLDNLKGSQYRSSTTPFLHTKSLISLTEFTRDAFKDHPFIM
ncbi:hypothetical protein POM88_054317 [Heracleum sosnowskyi]|uniref:F-box associated beta-propeller type 3 domain-containing protein n=1 Tax=Heracleum sosnowskyi TaxID=360622 RepID=A0AAD8LUY3_9APIA|nr:hypothetical protein POM88_054317 [Heracleum sosnowskyi]